MAITLSEIIETAMTDPDTFAIDAKKQEIWDTCKGTPFQKALFDFDALASEKLSAYVDAAFLAGYKLGSDPAAFVKACMEAPQ